MFKYNKLTGHTITLDRFIFNEFVSKIRGMSNCVWFRETTEPYTKLYHDGWYTFMIKCTEDVWSLIESDFKQWKELGHVLSYN